MFAARPRARLARLQAALPMSVCLCVRLFCQGTNTHSLGKRALVAPESASKALQRVAPGCYRACVLPGARRQRKSKLHCLVRVKNIYQSQPTQPNYYSRLAVLLFVGPAVNLLIDPPSQEQTLYIDAC